MKYKKKAEFPIEEAKELWAKGWCWESIGQKYGYTGETIKKWVNKSFTIKEYEKAHERHQENHWINCSYCFSKERRQKRKDRIKAKQMQETMFD